MTIARPDNALFTAGTPVAMACGGYFYGYWFSRSSA
ncbi:hypothetical protein Q668_12860 [Alcanivorax sp. PN-3]|nr:hypothetical protein Q668_12860 [Alcanivorax sp. PN-3]